MDNTNPQMPSSTQLSRKASPAVIILSILTLAGIGFGVFGMIKANQSANIEDFKIQISDNAGNITEIDANQITQSGDQGTITITESNSIKSFIEEINREEAKNDQRVYSYQLHSTESFYEDGGDNYYYETITVQIGTIEGIGGFARTYYKTSAADDWHFFEEGQAGSPCKDLLRDGLIAQIMATGDHMCYIEENGVYRDIRATYNKFTDKITYYEFNPSLLWNNEISL